MKIEKSNIFFLYPQNFVEQIIIKLESRININNIFPILNNSLNYLKKKKG